VPTTTPQIRSAGAATSSLLPSRASTWESFPAFRTIRSPASARVRYRWRWRRTAQWSGRRSLTGGLSLPAPELWSTGDDSVGKLSAISHPNYANSLNSAFRSS